MKKLLWAIFALMLVISSCSSEEEIKNQEDAPKQSNKEIIAHLVEKRGFKESAIVVEEDLFVVEGDICFERKQVEEEIKALSQKKMKKEVAQRHRRSRYLVTQVTNIPVFFESNVPSSWKVAIREAMSEWNNLQGDISFHEVGNCLNGECITVSFVYYASPNSPARAWTPNYYGYPGSKLQINSGYYNISSQKKKQIAVHELGHTIGFKHTDTFDGQPIYTACTSDPVSVMNAYAVRDWTGFTMCDILAFNALY